MKKLMFIASIVVLFASCKPSQVETLITDYEQNFDGTSIDLNLKINSLEKIKEWKAKDSLEILQPYFEKELSEKLEYLKTELKNDSLDLEEAIKKSKDPLYGDIYKSSVDLYQSSIKIKHEAIEAYSSNCKETYLEDTYNSIQNLKSSPESILYNIYECNYTIKNPMLNNTEQTITSKYFILPDESKIIGSE